MFIANMLRGAAALTIAAAILAGKPLAIAAARNVTPLDPNQCGAIARTIGQAVGISLKTTVGDPNLSDIHGAACLMTGHATGLKLEFDKAQEKLDASLQRAGWTAVIDFDADGPASTQKGFAKASQRIVYALSTEPPQGVCENVPIVDCKVPQRRWVWDLRLTAFVQ